MSRYLRFEIGFTRAKNVHRLSDAAFRLWVTSIDYAREQATDGVLDRSDLDILPRCPAGKRRVQAVQEIEQSGGWQSTETGWLIHGFLNWQDSAAKIAQDRDKARERMRSVRANNTRTTTEVRSTDNELEIMNKLKPPVSPPGGPIDTGPPKAKKPRKAPATPLPDDWQPHAKHREKALERGLDASKQSERFRANALAHDRRYANWDQAFFNWILSDFARPEHQNQRAPGAVLHDSRGLSERDLRLANAAKARLGRL